MYNKKKILSTGVCILGAGLITACSVTSSTSNDESSSTAMIAQPLEENAVEVNPYFASTESSIHNDIYGSDVTDYAMPLGIYTEIMEGEADERSLNSPPAFFYDSNGNAVAPYTQVQDDGSIISGGIAIVDMDSDDILTVLGSYMPETSAGGIQISYSFVDANNYLVGPTVNGHIKFIETTDSDGEVLENFNVVLDVDVLTAVQELLANESLNPNGIDVNLLSITYDYEGNLWFVSGGFFMDPTSTDAKQGFCGYIECEYIEANMGQEITGDVTDYIHVMTFDTPTTITNEDGTEEVLYTENVENGLAAHSEGCVILTNKQCYLFSADETAENGISINWSIPYESAGRKVGEDDGTEDGAGAGLAWGGGSSPTLTNNLVLFTDNEEVVNLYAVNIYTGEVEATTPVLDIGEEVAVENSICVYSSSEDLTSVLICNWLGAGKNYIEDSSVQQYDVLYDDDWRFLGSEYLNSGIERVDIIQNDDGSYTTESVWVRDDLKDTSMMKLSTGAGYYYGYTEDLETGEWGFIALDFETGETSLWVPVSDDVTYNNIAVGIMQGTTGNVVYCPTNSKILLSIRDRFVYLLDAPNSDLDITTMERQIVDEDVISGKTAVSYLMSVTISPEEVFSALDDDGNATIAFRVNGLSDKVNSYEVYMETEDGYELIDATITDEDGTEIKNSKTLDEDTIYEIRFDVEIVDTTEISIVIVQ